MIILQVSSLKTRCVGEGTYNGMAIGVIPSLAYLDELALAEEANSGMPRERPLCSTIPDRQCSQVDLHSSAPGCCFAETPSRLFTPHILQLSALSLAELLAKSICTVNIFAVVYQGGFVCIWTRL
jgi:hypothetical protein